MFLTAIYWLKGSCRGCIYRMEGNEYEENGGEEEGGGMNVHIEALC